MTEIATHFPPQTYSSSFFLNSLDEEDEGGRPKIRVKATEDSHNLLDSFITKMFKPLSITSPLFTFLLLQYTFFPTVEGECVDVNSPRTRAFANLVSFQTNKIPFDAADPRFDGNYVTFTEKNIDTLYKNSFVALDSDHIVKLFLDGHQIRVIQDGAFFSLSCVMTLNLQKNRIANISKGMFLDLKGLHELNLGENSITEIPERVFIYNARMRKLNITRNNLRVLHPESFYRLSFLEELDLSYNSLFRIPPDAFQFLNKLVNLQLGTNQLERLDLEKFTNLSKLNVLNLSNNALESFDSANNFSFASSLTGLYLNDNLLTQLNPLGVRNNLRMLQVIDIDDNPWFCPDLHPILSIFNDTRVSYKGSTVNSPNVAGIACNGSLEAYKRRKWRFLVESTTLHSVTTQIPKHNVEAATNTPLDSSNARIQQTLGDLYAVTVSLLIMVIFFFLLDIALKCGCLERLRRCRDRTPILDNDVETFSLLRQRF